jgi:hypothetical protein
LPFLPCLQEDITGNVTLANSLIGDRVIPPIGNGLCPCCPSSCTSNSVCHSTNQGCTQLNGPRLSAITTLIGNWSAKSECKAAPP